MNYPSCTCCSDLIAVRVEHEMLIAQVDAVLAELSRTRAELSDIANALRPPAA